MQCIISKWDDTREANKGNIVAKGLIRVNPNKPKYGSLMVISQSAPVITNGFLNLRKRVGFIVSEVSMLKTLIKQFDLKEGSDFSEQVAPHRIVVIEQLESQTDENTGFQPKINPSTNEFLFKGDERIMWKTEVVHEDSVMNDIFVSHNRTAPILQGDGVKALPYQDDQIHFVGEAKVDLSLTRKK